MGANDPIKKILRDIALTAFCLPIVNILIHEIGHFIFFALSDLNDAEFNVDVFSWHYSETISGYGLVSINYLVAPIIFMGGGLAALIAFVLYKKLSFSGYPILKFTMLWSAFMQILYANVEGAVNIGWLSKNHHNIDLSLVIALPIAVMYFVIELHEHKQKNKALESQALSKEA